ncbi:MAG: type IV pilin protein [Gammaproteobacteria bacterium]
MGSHKLKRGFTLIELMIVIAIVAILASIAYPSYQNHVRKSNRVEGKALLMQIIQQQERFKTENLTYAVDLSTIGGGYANPETTENGHYTISALACAGGITVCVNLTAAAVGMQLADGNLTLNSNNAKTGKW